MGFSLQWPPLFWSTGSVVVTRGLSSFMACGILLDQESNLCPRHGRWTPIHCTIREVLFHFRLLHIMLLRTMVCKFLCECLSSVLLGIYLGVELLHRMVRVYMHAKLLCCIRLFATPWTVTHQAPLSMGFSKQEHWSGLPCPPPGDLPDSGIEPVSPE